MTPDAARNFYEDDEDAERLIATFDALPKMKTVNRGHKKFCFICTVLGQYPWHLHRMSQAMDREKAEHFYDDDEDPEHVIARFDAGPQEVTGGPRYLLSNETLNAIQAEATRAHRKHGEHSMMGELYTSGDRLAILVEEVGEVAHELTYDQGGPGVGEGRYTELMAELTQVAAMAASWMEFLLARKKAGY